MKGISSLNEIILNIYIIIEEGNVNSFRAKSYSIEGSDDEKIKFLKSRVKGDFNFSEIFNAPQNKKQNFMPYSKFAKLESQGMQYQLFEEIFYKFQVQQNPIICVTPVVDGIILSD